jgi:uncharacterized membrane protein
MIDIMPWYVWALVSAISVSIMDIFSKKALERVHAIEFRTTFKTFQIPILLMLLPFVRLDISLFYIALCASVALGAVIAGIFWAKSMKHGEISFVAPMKNISPLFVAVLSYFILGESMTLKQGLGIFIIIIGTYILEVDHGFSDLKRPLIRFFKSRIVHFVIISIFIYAICSIGDKYVLGFLDEFTYMFWVWLFMIIFYNIISMIFYNGPKDIIYCMKKAWFPIMMVAIFSFLSGITALKALTLAMVSLVTPIKRLSSLFSTIIGGELFHDHGLKTKMIACIILMIGSLLIVL